jgi:hypothetical protein
LATQRRCQPESREKTARWLILLLLTAPVGSNERRGWSALGQR